MSHASVETASYEYHCVALSCWAIELFFYYHQKHAMIVEIFEKNIYSPEVSPGIIQVGIQNGSVWRQSAQ